MKKLTTKQEKFCVLYVKYADGTRAYIEAYNCKNYNTAKSNAYRNLQRKDIKERIKELTSSEDNKRIASAIEVLEYLSSIVRGEDEKATVQDRTRASETLLKRYKVFDNVDKKMEDLKRKQIELDIKRREIEIERLTNGDGDNKTISALDRLEVALNE